MSQLTHASAAKSSGPRMALRCADIDRRDRTRAVKQGRTLPACRPALVAAKREAPSLVLWRGPARVGDGAAVRREAGGTLGAALAPGGLNLPSFGRHAVSVLPTGRGYGDRIGLDTQCSCRGTSRDHQRDQSRVAALLFLEVDPGVLGSSGKRGTSRLEQFRSARAGGDQALDR
mgnify:CR=1 FL=1